MATRAEERSVYDGVGDGLRPVPIARDDRPHDLIEVFPVLQQRTAQNSFLQRTELSQRAVASAVLDRGTRLETINASVLEGKVDGGSGAREEQACSPER